MNLLSEMADAKYSQMQSKADVSREAQSKANEVDEMIAGMLKDNATGQLPPDVVKYMQDNGITVDGVSITEYLKANDPAAPYLDKLKSKIEESGPSGMQSYSWHDVVSYMDKHGTKVYGKSAGPYTTLTLLTQRNEQTR